MRFSGTIPHEHVVAAKFEYECKKRGAQRMSYPPVVGGGERARTIHYLRNDSKRAVYSAVLHAHQECVKLCKPGNMLNSIHDHATRLLSDAILDLGIVKNQPYSAMTASAILTKVFPHAVGHWLGMDTHDCDTVLLSEPLQAGVILTIEPGLYFPDDPDIPSESQLEQRGLLSPICSYSGSSTQQQVADLEHCLLYCPMVRQIWQWWTAAWHFLTVTEFPWDQMAILLNDFSKSRL
ncbi:hypothetical protein CBR_g23088 [Chara braunii]|uniref:Peptidase M24 domain-containing protein n=1 Tax=Chara braunii TaxID=69332 RepID=A0A388L3U2_CHABU|nr:hypothetical protein CBR_g23088 [Chara braunii]|eukprot:GBG76873.1 hypothetical protein CBR_g23088 [Chara braunii]